MHLRHALAVGLLAAAAAAQNTNLPIIPTGAQYLWGPPNTSTQCFVDMTVNTTITLQGLTFGTITPIGIAGSVEVWLTNPGITTYVGNELNPAVWTRVALGSTVQQPQPAAPSVCFGNGAVIQPGTYGVAVRYNNVDCLFNNNNASQTFSNAELTVVGGATQSGAFTVAPFANYVLSGTLYYAIGAVQQDCATKATYGSGCYPTNGSYYQRFASASATAAALNGRTVTHTYAGSLYLVAPGVGVSYVPPTAAAVALPAGNNNQSPVNLPSQFAYPGGSTNILYVSTNGYVSDQPLAALPGSISYLPSEFGLLEASATVWALAFHDYNSSEVGSGLILYEQVGNLFCITWDNVESYPDASANPTRMQIQFDLATQNVNYVWVTMDPIGGSPYHDLTVVGFSPAGPSPDLGPVDIATLGQLVLTTPEVLPLSLAASAPALLGSTVDLTTANEINSSLGVNFLSTTALPAPGVDLGVIGAGGCRALIDVNAAVGNVISNLGAPLPGMTISFPIPANPALSGISIASQSVWLDPAANAFGIKTSNGVLLTLGLFAL